MTPCDRDLLAALACGALDDAHALALDRHLEGCPSCAHELRALAGVAAALADHGPALAPRSIAAELWLHRAWWLAPAVAVAALLAVVLVFAEGSTFAPFIYSIF